MTIAGKKSVSLNEISQEIELDKYLGKKPTQAQKTLFAALAKDVIENRTLDGDDINGKVFKSYDPDYADKKGVTIDSVDLFLHGDMLEGIGRRKSKERVNTVFMQMKKGLQTKKAFRHDTGDAGAKKREFFGITDKEAKDIAREVNNAVPSDTKKTITLAEIRDALSLLGIEQV